MLCGTIDSAGGSLYACAKDSYVEKNNKHSLPEASAARKQLVLQ
jgi:hypothetical protein